jgi:hypothetical protein
MRMQLNCRDDWFESADLWSTPPTRSVVTELLRPIILPSGDTVHPEIIRQRFENEVIAPRVLLRIVWCCLGDGDE